MEDYRFSVSCLLYTDSIASKVNSLLTLDLFGFEIYIPVAAFNDLELKTAIKHGGSQDQMMFPKI